MRERMEETVLHRAVSRHRVNRKPESYLCGTVLHRTVTKSSCKGSLKVSIS